MIRLPVVGEALGFGIHFQNGLKRQRRLMQVHLVGAEMFFHPSQRFSQVMIRFGGGVNGFQRQMPPELIRDISRMNQGGGEMAFCNVGVQVRYFAAADRLQEVRKVIAAGIVGF